MSGPLTSVFLLWHSRDKGEGETDDKLIGVYATKEDASAAIARVADQPGFKDAPDGFEIDEYIVGKDHWQEGFFLTAEE